MGEDAVSKIDEMTSKQSLSRWFTLSAVFILSSTYNLLRLPLPVEMAIATAGIAVAGFALSWWSANIKRIRG